MNNDGVDMEKAIQQELEDYRQAQEMERQPYILRFFFDHIHCLWSDNQKARDEFGYPVHLSDLPLSSATIERGEQLISFWDGPFCWGAGRPDWSPEQYGEEAARFRAKALSYCETLQDELGSGFIVRNMLT